MDSNYILTTDGELYHYGRVGMKWGKRLYQNKDGSLTALGKMRYNKQQKDAIKKRKATIEAKKKAAAEEAAAKEKRAKDVAAGKISSKKMTEEELRTRIERLNLEKTYNDALAAQKSATNNKAQKFMDKFLNTTIDKVAENVSADLVSQALKVIATKGVNAALEKGGFDADVHTNNKKK